MSAAAPEDRLKAAVVQVTPFEQNCTLIWDQAPKRGAVIDPGGDVDRIEGAIAQVGLTVEKIVLTHGHLDHVGGAAELKQKLGVPIEGPHIADKFLMDGVEEQAARYGLSGMRNATSDRWMEEGETLTIVEDGFDGPVSRVDVAASGEVIAGGFFTRVGDVSARNIARRAGSAWSALGEGVPGQVMAIARDAERVYVSTSDLGEGALLLGAFDGTTWRELATAEAGLTAREYFTFETLRVIDGALLGAGTVDLDDGSGRGALMYRDGRFRAIGGGVRAMWLGSIVLTDDAMWVGGIAAEAGHGDTRVPSVGIARFAFGE